MVCSTKARLIRRAKHFALDLISIRRLFFAGISQFGDDLLPQHFAAIIKNFNQAGAAPSSVGNGRSKIRSGKNADDLPLVLSSLDPQFVLLPLGHGLVSHIGWKFKTEQMEGRT